MLQLLLFLPFLGASDGPPMDLGLRPGGGAASDSSSGGCSVAELDLSGIGFSRMHSVPKPPASAWLRGLPGDFSKLSLTQDSGAGGHLQGTCTCCHGNTAGGVLQLCLLALTKELFGLKKAAFSPEAAQSPNICLTASHLPDPGDRYKDREASGVSPCGNSPTHRRTASPP